MDWTQALADFRFLEPGWLLALLPLALLLWLAMRWVRPGSTWRGIVDPPLLAALTRVQAQADRRWFLRLPLLLLSLAWLIGVLALANPSVERQPVPVYETGKAQVLVLDLSRSMLAQDLRPDRLRQAKFKLADVLARAEGTRLGLVVFAGDAFGVVPLTEDAETLEAMLDALDPGLMPVQGSRPDLGIDQALELLNQASASGGRVLLLSDDAGGQRALAAAERLREAGHRLSVLGVGTPTGAEVPGVSSETGSVWSQLDEAALRRLASAGGGVYSRLGFDGRDLDAVLGASWSGGGGTLESGASDGEQRLTEIWKPLGPWLSLTLLPLGALAFRRGWLLTLAVSILLPGLLVLPRPAMAGFWADLWQRPDQQSAKALALGDYALAEQRAPDAEYLGSARYRQGDYRAAAEAFAAGETAWHHYNRGNALALAGDLQDALAAYDLALQEEPGMEDAVYNRDQVQAMLDRQRDQAASNPEPQGSDQASNDATSRPNDDPAGEQGQAEQTAGQGAGADQADERQPEAEASMGDQSSNDQRASSGDSEMAEQAAADYRDLAREAMPATNAAISSDESANNASEQSSAEQGADPVPAGLTREEREARQAAEQWLRRIPDDPGGLLRRKFLYQYRERAAVGGAPGRGDPW